LMNAWHSITPENAVYCLLSFEGPDPYSRAGGLGTRVTELSRTLAETGYQTHLFFVGDPEKPARERTCDGRLSLWRVVQDVSRYYLQGVYDGEHEKHTVYSTVVPHLVVQEVAQPAIEQQKIVIVIGEDWHTAEAMWRISDMLFWRGIRRHALLLWNANNVFGFEHIDWARLRMTTHITTVSRYMKYRLWEYGVNALVIPNGIPSRYLEPVDASLVHALRQPLGGRLLLTKVGRFDPGKNWIPAIQAVAKLKHLNLRPLFVMRGGIEPHGHEVIAEIERLRLRHVDLHVSPNIPHDAVVRKITAAAAEADIVNLCFFVPEPVLRALFCASDAVLANSRHEPFGLVGLEVMAAGGIAFTGSTGEDYAQHLLNAITLDTDSPDEIVGHLLYLREHPAIARNLRRVGRITARFYLWDAILEKLQSKLQHFIMSNQLG